MDSKEYIEDIIYDDYGQLKKPDPYNDLYYLIQTFVYLYQSNPDWPESFKQDIKQYVQDCTDILAKM